MYTDLPSTSSVMLFIFEPITAFATVDAITNKYLEVEQNLESMKNKLLHTKVKTFLVSNVDKE